MPVLDADLTRARHEAAVAGSFTGRLMVLSRELDVLLKRERELKEKVDVGDGETEIFNDEGLEDLLRTFTEHKKPVQDAFDFVGALLQRRVNRQAVADLVRQRDELLLNEVAFADSLARYTEISSRWAAMNSQGDPGMGISLSKLEKEEKEVEVLNLRLEQADIAAEEAERALENLRVILHDAVDWVPGDAATKEPDTAILRPERLGPADPWIGVAQVALSRAKYALEEIGLESGAFQLELLGDFGHLCYGGMFQDLAEKDGIDRALRPVTWTLTTVRALRGHLSKCRGDTRHRLQDAHDRRERLFRRRTR